MKLKWYSDPGHGWLAVKRKVLNEYGVANQISPYSYQRGGTVYLEEDSDAQKMINALAQKGVAIVFQHHQTDRRSPIRSYDCFTK